MVWWHQFCPEVFKVESSRGIYYGDIQRKEDDMSKLLSPLQRETLAFIQDFGPCTDEDIEAGVLLQVHGLDYNGGGWEEAMEKAAAWISLMEVLREYSVIGTGCDESAENGQPCDHLPETCLSEERETHAWIVGVSSGSVGGAHAVHLITEMARSKWFTRHGAAADEEMHQRIDRWIDWTCDLCPNS